jgi:DNA-binding NarL/FixJ family response regulator
MTHPSSGERNERCAVVGVRHPGLREGVRQLVEARFSPVVAVQSEESLTEIAERFEVQLAVVDLALGRGDGLGMLRRLRHRFPSLPLIVVSLHDSPEVERAVLAAGADRLILAGVAATELLPAACSLGMVRRP